MNPTASGSGKPRGESAVDRLIDLASNETSSVALAPKEIEKTPRDLAVPVAEKDMEENSMWKVLLQLKSVLPYVARLLPLLDAGVGHAQSSALSTEVKSQVGELQTSHRDLRLTLQDQTLQLKRFEEQVTRLSDAADKNAVRHAELAEDLKSIRTFVQTAVISLGALLIVLIVMVGFLFAHRP